MMGLYTEGFQMLRNSRMQIINKLNMIVFKMVIMIYCDYSINSQQIPADDLLINLNPSLSPHSRRTNSASLCFRPTYSLMGRTKSCRWKQVRSCNFLTEHKSSGKSVSVLLTLLCPGMSLSQEPTSSTPTAQQLTTDRLCAARCLWSTISSSSPRRSEYDVPEQSHHIRWKTLELVLPRSGQNMEIFFFQDFPESKIHKMSFLSFFLAFFPACNAWNRLIGSHSVGAPGLQHPLIILRVVVGRG